MIAVLRDNAGPWEVPEARRLITMGRQNYVSNTFLLTGALVPPSPSVTVSVICRVAVDELLPQK